MGIWVAFFRASDDEAAAAAEQRPGGPLGWPSEVGRRRTGFFRTEPIIETLGPAYDGFEARGYDGAVNMGTLEEILTGRPYGDLERDPRWGAELSGHLEPADFGVLTLTQTLRDALAGLEDSDLEGVVRRWAATEELRPLGGEPIAEEEVAVHRETVRQLRDLARRASLEGDQLYWFFQL